uniref:Ig-like domain-containing protein n=1 Tax=Macrostomum lignano TaxID=282301 RepID=A0A1I8IN49_9PLAT
VSAVFSHQPEDKQAARNDTVVFRCEIDRLPRTQLDSRQVRSGGIGDPHPAGVPDEGAEVSDIVRGGQLVHPLGVAEVFVPRLVETFLEKHLTLVENGNTRSSAAVEQRAVGEAVNALAAPVHTDIQRNVVSARDGGLEAPPDVEGGRGGRVRTCDGTANAALKLVQPLTGGLLLQHASPDETRVCDTGPDDAGINPTDRSRREAPSRPDGSAQLGKAAFCPTDDVIKVLRPAQVMPHGLTSAPIAGWTTPEQQVEDDLPRSDVGGKIVLLEGVFPLRGETHGGGGRARSTTKGGRAVVQVSQEMDTRLASASSSWASSLKARMTLPLAFRIASTLMSRASFSQRKSSIMPIDASIWAVVSVPLAARTQILNFGSVATLAYVPALASFGLLGSSEGSVRSSGCCLFRSEPAEVLSSRLRRLTTWKPRGSGRPPVHTLQDQGAGGRLRAWDTGARSTVTNPPVTNPPVTNPPVTNPPVTNPPVTNPAVTNLSRRWYYSESSSTLPYRLADRLAGQFLLHREGAQLEIRLTGADWRRAFGLYRCDAPVPGGRGFVHSRLAALTPAPKNRPRPPLWFEAAPPARVSGRVGEPLTLVCAANGAAGSSQIDWLRGSAALQTRGSESREIYTQTELAVLSPPRFLDAPDGDAPLPSGAVTAFVGGAATLRCDATGNPQPSIDWVKDGQPLSQKPPFVRQLGQELRLRGLVAGDSGLYQCLAGSPAGSAQRLTQLIVLAASAASESAIGGQPPRRGGLFSQPDSPTNL